MSLRSNLREVRTRVGLSQQELAALAGVTRQTISGIESATFAPTTAVALRIARALGCQVEELFWLEEELPEIEAVLAGGGEGSGEDPGGGPVRVSLARIGGRWVAHPLRGDSAFRTAMVPADGQGQTTPGGGTTVRVRPFDEPQGLLGSVVLAGCTPALSLWAEAAQRWYPGLRVHWLFANSSQALAALARGEVHAAGIHFAAADDPAGNLPYAQRALPGQDLHLVRLGTWAEGLLLRPGDPLGIRGVADLGRPGVRIVNREAGAGSRHLLEWALQQAGVAPDAGEGFQEIRHDHLEVARAVAAGEADAGVSAAPVAAAFGLDFRPLRRVHYDMVVPAAYLHEAPVRQIFASLSHTRVRTQLQELGGFETAQTGEVVGRTAPGSPGESAEPSR